MFRKNRVSAALAATVIAVCGLSAPALASGKHWTKKQCESYVKSFDKAHKKPTKSQTSSANKTLKSWGCKQTVK
ncbi:MAG TPA: hypothetical protein VED41_12665 [Solirubrobacteraceae bacterium]|nr:hypothetical protein [Solirubrobacteraceae bacterium]